MGHSTKEPAHSGQTERCAQGRIRIDTLFSMHTAHKFVSGVGETLTKLSSNSHSPLEIKKSEKINDHVNTTKK